jgi:hypothetical protein
MHFTIALAQVSHSLPYNYNNQCSRPMNRPLTTGELTSAGGNYINICVMNSGLCCAKEI